MPSLSRRDLLRLAAAGGVGAALAACTRGGSTPAPTEPGGPEDPDRALRAEQGEAESQMSARYVAAAPVITGALGARVTALGARHDAYRQAIDPDRLAASPSIGTASASTPGATATLPVPGTEAAAIAGLLAAETAAARQRAVAAARAVDPELARYIVLAGAGSAAAAEVLRGESR